ncbi:hypothetical protein Q8A67_005641 [Cirrhinus molitorella]|uniref:Uncharacterized protein n=1 Tax=Cirrhinus molitorella TaxID=172907 RepID=A0AA88U2C2_9TELE|nr:hypothetical protein Q8A67_005641 [Cirrhinus molitorella]
MKIFVFLLILLQGEGAFGATDEVKSISVMEGNSVTLHTDLTEIQKVEYQDKNIYSCVLNNPISNQTQHLDISKLCHTCAVDTEDGLSLHHIVLICIGVVVILQVLAAVGAFSIYRKHRKTDQLRQTQEQEFFEMNNDSPDDGLAETDELKIVAVNVGGTVVLNTGTGEISSPSHLLSEIPQKTKRMCQRRQ